MSKLTKVTPGGYKANRRGKSAEFCRQYDERQRAHYANKFEKRRLENEQRILQGLDPLPDEEIPVFADMTPQLFEAIMRQARLEAEALNQQKSTQASAAFSQNPEASNDE